MSGCCQKLISLYICTIVSTSGNNCCSIPVRWQRRTKGLLPSLHRCIHISLCVEPDIRKIILFGFLYHCNAGYRGNSQIWGFSANMDAFIRQRGTRTSSGIHPTLEANKQTRKIIKNALLTTVQCLKGGACPAPRWRQDECYMGLSVKLVTCTRNVYQAYLSEASMDSILESKLEARF